MKKFTLFERREAPATPAAGLCGAIWPHHNLSPDDCSCTVPLEGSRHRGEHRDAAGHEWSTGWDFGIDAVPEAVKPRW